MKDFADITVLVDRSGSMESCREAMEEAYRGFIKEHRKVPSTRITLIQFDGSNNHEVIYTASPVRDAGELHIDPRGSTPLIDALVKTIDSTGARLRAMDERYRPNKVIMVVITDGHENSSHIYKKEELNGRISKQRGKYNWQFVYLGADINAVNDAVSYGFASGNSAYFVGENAGFRAAGQAATQNTMSYVTGQTTGVEAFSAMQLLNMAHPEEDEKQKKVKQSE